MKFNSQGNKNWYLIPKGIEIWFQRELQIEKLIPFFERPFERFTNVHISRLNPSGFSSLISKGIKIET